MVKFREVTPEEMKNVKPGRRGRVSYPIIKAFMETGHYIAQVDLKDLGRKANNTYAVLKSYVSNNEIPVKPLIRSGRLYLMRLDIDEEGNAIEDWKEKNDPIAKESWKAEEGPLLDGDAVDNA